MQSMVKFQLNAITCPGICKSNIFIRIINEKPTKQEKRIIWPIYSLELNSCYFMPAFLVLGIIP